MRKFSEYLRRNLKLVLRGDQIMNMICKISIEEDLQWKNEKIVSEFNFTIMENLTSSISKWIPIWGKNLRRNLKLVSRGVQIMNMNCKISTQEIHSISAMISTQIRRYHFQVINKPYRISAI